MTKAHTLRVELVISAALRVGVLMAFALVSAGGALYLIQHHGDVLPFHYFNGESSDLRTIGSIWAYARHFRSDALIQLGLLVLIATPIARVLMAAIGFAIDGDGLYVTVSLIVFSILMYSLFHAI